MQPASKGSIGADSGVSAFRGLGYTNWDASIMKNLGAEAARFVQVRFETYNVFARQPGRSPTWRLTLAVRAVVSSATAR